MAATKNPLGRLGHMRDEIEAITVALRDANRDAFVENYLLRRAAERALQIISEAAKALPKDLTDRHPEIDWRGVACAGSATCCGTTTSVSMPIRYGKSSPKSCPSSRP
jgi:uncharacterized protein with HEPN domain